jgi:hypothetical protein
MLLSNAQMKSLNLGMKPMQKLLALILWVIICPAHMGSSIVCFYHTTADSGNFKIGKVIW